MKTINRIIWLFVFLTSFSTFALAQPSKKDLARALYDFSQEEILTMLPMDLGDIIWENYSYGDEDVQSTFIFKDNNTFKTYKDYSSAQKYQVMLELANANTITVKASRLLYIDIGRNLKYVYYNPDKSDSYSFVISVEDLISMLDVDAVTQEYRRDVMTSHFSSIMPEMFSENAKVSFTDNAIVTTVYTPIFIFDDPEYTEENDLPYINSEITGVDEPGFILEILACYLEIDVEYVFVDSNNGKTHKITADRQILEKKVEDWLKTQK